VARREGGTPSLKEMGGATGNAAIMTMIVFSATVSERFNLLKVGVALPYGLPTTE